MSKSTFTSGNEKHVVYKKTTKRGEGKIGDIMVNHPTKDKGTYDTISLTRTSNAKTIKQGVAAEKKWHTANPYGDGVKKLSYKDWKASLPKNLQSEENYNLKGAYEEGLEPELNEDGSYHLGSRNPRTGEILKKPSHPTFKMGIEADKKLGYVPLIKPDGKVYTQNPEEQTYVSGAKSVKQYRGDENLPEAKNGMKKGCGCKHSKSKYKYASGTKSAYIPFPQMQPFQQSQYRMGMQKDADFTVTNIGKYAKPTKAQKELSARMDAKYKAEAKKRKVHQQQTPVQSKPAPAKTTPVTLPPPVQIIPTAPVVTPPVPPITPPVVTKPTEESWTETQWQDFLKEKNNVPYVKPTPYIPVAKKQVIAPIVPSKPKTKPINAKFLDPNSKGVLISQKGKPVPISNKSLSEVTTNQMLKGENEKRAWNLYPNANDPINRSKYPVNTRFNSKPVQQEIKKENSKVVKTENKKNEFVNTNWNPNDETLLIDKILPEGDVKEIIKNNPIQRWPGIAKNWVQRKWDLMNPEDEVVSTGFKEPSQPAFTVGAKPVNKTKSIEQYKSILQSNPMVVGDTVKIKDLGKNRYYLNEKIDLNDPALSFGTRSRDEFPEGGINTEAAPITTTEPWQSSKNFNFDENSEYIGVNSRGKIKTGKAKDFKDDDYKVSKVYLFNIENFASDEKGNQLFSPDESNKGFDLPVVNFITPSGEKRTANINLMVPQTKNSKYNESAFGPTSGGGFIIESPDQKERILIRGSLKDIRNEFNQMKNKGKYQYLRVIPMDNGSFARGLRTMDQNLDKKDLETYDAQNTTGGHVAYIKSRSKKYKYGTSALTIPEGSAIVTANGGKNMQALKAYKKGNYKLLNKIIDDMPEDNVDKAQAGKKTTKIKGKYTTTDPTTKEVFQEQSVLGGGEEGYGSELPQDKAEEIYKMSEADLKRKHKGITVAQELARRQAVANKKDTFTFTYQGKEYKGHKDAGYSSGYKEQEMTYPGGPGGGSSNTTKTPPEDEYEEVDTDTIKPNNPAMSAAETSAIGSVLSRGVPRGAKESYLNLNKYNYASQLDRTLRENAVAANAAKETIRDVAGGNAGNFLSNVGNITGKRFDANSGAVTEDTLARQDILNKNVDISNVEATTNRNLKDYYDDIKRQNVNDYNALLVKGGQSFDESFDNYQKMKNENQLKAQELQLLKESNPNYTMVKDPKTGLMKSVYRYKKVNPAGTQTTTGTTTGTAPATSTTSTTSSGTATSGRMTMNGAPAPATTAPSVNSNAAPSTNTFSTQAGNYASGVTNKFSNSPLAKTANYLSQIQEDVMPNDEKFKNFQSRIGRFTKKVGAKKLKTYKRK